MNGVRCEVVTVSDRVSSGVRADLCGPALVAALAAAGYDPTARVVPDGAGSVETALLAALDAGARLIITTGGTGVGPRDRTPEGSVRVIDRELPGVADLLRRHGAATTVHAVLGRGIAGVVDTGGRGPALIVNLPGSPKGALDGLGLLLPLVPHILDQLGGGDH